MLLSVVTPNTCTSIACTCINFVITLFHTFIYESNFRELAEGSRNENLYKQPPPSEELHIKSVNKNKHMLRFNLT